MGALAKVVEFQPNLPGMERSEIDLLREDVSVLKEQTANVRRGLFARHTELCNLYLQQQKEIDALKEVFKSQKG